MWYNKPCLEMGNGFSQAPGCAGANTAQEAVWTCLLPRPVAHQDLFSKAGPQAGSPQPQFSPTPFFYKASLLAGSPLTKPHMNFYTTSAFLRMLVSIIYHTALVFYPKWAKVS